MILFPVKSKNGNVLFLILIAVALFAALSYAVTQSGRGGSKDISDEQAKLFASQMMQYATQIKNGISRIQILNNCQDIQISFERPPFDGSDTIYDNANSPSDFGCHVFHPDGAAISYMEPPQDIFVEHNATFVTRAGNEFGKYMFVGSAGITNVGTNCSSGACNELMLVVPSISEYMCLEILQSKGESTVTSAGLPHFGSQIGGFSTFNGQGGNASHGDFWGAGASSISHANLAGTYYGCYMTHPLDGSYHFYHVLIAR